MNLEQSNMFNILRFVTEYVCVRVCVCVCFRNMDLCDTHNEQTVTESDCITS
jgi:hypothetical protein